MENNEEALKNQWGPLEFLKVTYRVKWIKFICGRIFSPSWLESCVAESDGIGHLSDQSLSEKMSAMMIKEEYKFLKVKYIIPP